MKEITFKYNFRPYQRRIIEETKKYLEDGKVHIVAAPGAGKTIVALKLVFDLDMPTLVLVPTIAIREQWVERMMQDFIYMPIEEISTSLKDVKKYTVITYQSLYEYKPEEIKNILMANNIRTIVFDEAHHLRNAWFNHITKFINELNYIKTISLTATPPYDDTKLYNNYISLCGEIDTIVDAPELVANHNLCPHQDFICFNSITQEDEKEILKYRKIAYSLANQLLNEELFIRAIAMHRFIVDFQNNITGIAANEKSFFTMIKILKRNRIVIPKELEKIKLKNNIIKTQDLEALFELALLGKDEDFKIISKLCSKYKSAFMKIGAVEKGIINLSYSKEIIKALTDNQGKLDSINQIIVKEQESLGSSLKLIIVSDYIKDYKTIDDDTVNDTKDNQYGVIPIFNNIRNGIGDKVKPAVLTGSIVLIPAYLKDELIKICENTNIKKEDLVIREYDIDFDFLEVKIGSNEKTVSVITKLFEQTDLSVLVGTTALIGEGWDAPFVNTLIIASNVSTYITSNQVRGRVSRIYKKDTRKVANIWHLVTLEKSDNRYIKGEDYEKIKTRLGHMEGLGLSKDLILSGMQRFEDDINRELKENNIYNLNEYMFNISKDREKIRNSWQVALTFYKRTDMVPTNICDVDRSNKNIGVKVNSFKKFSARLTGMAIGTYAVVMTSIQLLPLEAIFLPIIGVSLVDSYLLNKWCVIDGGNIKNNSAYDVISKVILISLKEKKLIEEDAKARLFMHYGRFFIQFENADIRTQSIIKKCLEEAISFQIETRYIIKAGFYRFNVPSIFDKTKASAEKFLSHCKKHLVFKMAKLVYTKGTAGKLEKLKMKVLEDNNSDYEKDIEELCAETSVISNVLDTL